MSEVTNTINTDNQQSNDFDTSKLLLGFDNKFETGYYNNSTYADVTLAAGTVMGRIATTNYLVPLDAGASDGSQFPVGILAQEHTIATGDTNNMNIVVAGEVAEEKVVLTDGSTLETVIASKRIKDRISSDTAGIVLVAGTELTGTDNV
jgi:hypothetical protein